MIGASSSLSVYLMPGVTDMRKSIDGLSLIVSEVLELDPSGCSGSGHRINPP